MSRLRADNHPLPTLEDIFRDPARIAELTQQAILDLGRQASAVTLYLLNYADRAEVTTSPDRLLTAEDAAERMGKSVKWMKLRGKALPFAVKTGRTWCFSESGLAKWIKQRSWR